jgi:hypothetical protein
MMAKTSPLGSGDSAELEKKLVDAFGALAPKPDPSVTPYEAHDQGYALGVQQTLEQIEANLAAGTLVIGGKSVVVAETFPGPMIWTLLARAMNEVLAVGKHGFNEQQKYNFRGIDDVINALGPALRKHGVIPVPRLQKATYRDTLTTGKASPTREVTVEVCYCFTAPDGSVAEVIVPGESLDQSDKGSAKAMSVAYRIALIQLFCLPTHEPDPDSSYSTRSGMGAMAATVATLIGEKLPVATAYEMALYWPIIEEHSAAERPMSGAPDSPTWLGAFAARYAELIEQVETVEEGRELVAVMVQGSAGWRVGDTNIKALASARGKYVVERQEKTFDHCMEQITGAQTLAELETAWGCAFAAFEVKVLSEEQMTQLQEVAQERKPKLPSAPEALADEEPGEALTTSGHPDLFKPAMGPAWEMFRSSADLPDLAFSHINDLITNESEIFDAPAAEWGTAGLQRVQDAIIRSNVRDETITRDEREELERRLRHYAAGVGITWPTP